MPAGIPEISDPTSVRPRRWFYRPGLLIGGAAFVGLLVGGGQGFLLGMALGLVASLVASPFVKQVRAGLIPREDRLHLISSVLEEHPEAVRSAFPNAGRRQRSRAVGKALETIARRAASVAPDPSSVWDAGNVQRAAGELMEEQPTDAMCELYRVLALRIDMDWYGPDPHRPVSYLPEMYDPVEEELFGDIKYERWEAPSGRRNHVLTVTGDGATLQLRCSGQPPGAELELNVDDDLPEQSALVRWRFDDGQSREAEWDVGLGKCVTSDDSSVLRSFVEEAVRSEEVAITVEGAEDGVVNRYEFGVRGIRNGLQRTPCFRE